jgi:hypothetical protein
MKVWAFIATFAGIVALSSAPVEAQTTTASGSAFGTILRLLDAANLVDQSDTGTVTAPNPSGTPSYDTTAAGATIPAAPLAEVVTGPSRVRGCSATGGCPNLFPTPAPAGALPAGLAAGKQFARSEAGNATASVLIDQAPGNVNVLDVVSNGASAQVACNTSGRAVPSAESHVDLLVIAGNVVPIPGVVNPNTTIVASQLPLLVLNEQFCPDPSAPAGTTRCIVNAVHAQLLDPVIPGPLPGQGSVLDLKVSGATASLTNAQCPGGGGNDDCDPNLTNSAKTSEILQADRTTPKTQQIPAVGDPIRFTITAANSAVANPSCAAGAQTGHNLRVIDRIPLGITVDTTSITIQVDNGAQVPTTGSIASCSGSLQFTGCGDEKVSDTSRQCLTITDSDITPGQTKKIRFIGTVNSNATGGNTVGCDSTGTGAGICNTALIQIDEIQNASGTPRTSGILCPIPSGIGIGGGGTDFLKTTGSGGCSLRAGSARVGSETLPVLALGVWLVVRRWRQKRASA